MAFGSNKILVIGEKETFIIKVLLGKLKDAGITALFSKADVNDINEEWGDSGLRVEFYSTTD